VLLLNDYTPMDFVIRAGRFFNKDPRARRIMLHVHQNGIGSAASTYEVAETKVTQDDFARKHQHPLNV
jgi:ATP-dependent Clp protease adapter protein ClpS